MLFRSAAATGPGSGGGGGGSVAGAGPGRKSSGTSRGERPLLSQVVPAAPLISQVVPAPPLPSQDLQDEVEFDVCQRPQRVVASAEGGVRASSSSHVEVTTAAAVWRRRGMETGGGHEDDRTVQQQPVVSASLSVTALMQPHTNSTCTSVLDCQQHAHPLFLVLLVRGDHLLPRWVALPCGTPSRSSPSAASSSASCGVDRVKKSSYQVGK